MKIGDKVITPSGNLGTVEGVRFGSWVVAIKDVHGDIIDHRIYEECELKADKGMENPQKHYNKHYLEMVIQPAKMAMDLLTTEEFVGWLKGQMIRYGKRAGFKEGEPPEKDKNKYEHYDSWKKEFIATGTIKELE